METDNPIIENLNLLEFQIFLKEDKKLFLAIELLEKYKDIYFNNLKESFKEWKLRKNNSSI